MSACFNLMYWLNSDGDGCINVMAWGKYDLTVT